jgi:farnesyl diphosphate synthase/geranylgeranyl diphosphate synthase type II
MDNDDIRHNQPTSHKVFGEAQAILVWRWSPGFGISSLISNDPHCLMLIQK